MLIPGVTACLIYAGCVWMLPGPGGLIAAIFATTAYVCSPAVFRSSELAPHQLFVMWFIIALTLLAKMLATGDRRFWYGAVAVTALAFGTLEVTFVLIAVVLVCGFLERRRLAFDWSVAARSLILFAAIVVLIHPATLTKVAFAKSYLYYAYLSVHRTNAWGDVTFADTWITRFTNSPIEWLLIAAAIVMWFKSREMPGHRIAIPFLLFGVLMLGSMLRVLTTGARYMLPYVPAFHVFTGIVLSGVVLRWRAPARIAATALIPAALVGNGLLYLMDHPYEPDPREPSVLAKIGQMNLGSSRLLVPHDDLPTIHYYYPHADLTGYTDEFCLPPGEFDALVSSRDASVREIRK
jgi:hypothetical protein